MLLIFAMFWTILQYLIPFLNVQETIKIFQNIIDSNKLIESLRKHFKTLQIIQKSSKKKIII